MRKKIRIAARSLFVTSLSLTLLFSSPTYTMVNADSLSSLQSTYSELQKQQQQLQQQLNKLNSEVTTESRRKAALDKNITVIKQQVAVLNTQINTLNTQIDDKNSDIKDTQKRIDSNTEQYKKRICAIYEAGNASKLEILLSSKSVTDFLMRFETMQVISDHDNKVINDLKHDQASLKADKLDLQQKLTSLQSSRGTIAAKQQVLKAELAQQVEVIAKLKNNAGAKKQETAVVSQKARETDAQINAEIAKRAAARKRELEKQQSGSSSGGNGSTVSGNYLVSYAEGFVGTPYVFGSADPRYGFDCSGFVQYVYANAAGIALTHSAAAQSGYGTAVSKDSLQPGDVVFFDTNGGNSINHCGIYIGNDQFIAANTGSKMAVTINGLFSSSYWSNYYRCARRILN